MKGQLVSVGDVAVQISADGDRFELSTSGASYRFDISDDGVIRHVGFLAVANRGLLDTVRASASPAPEAEVGLDDEPLQAHHGPRSIGMSASLRARYRRHRVEPTDLGVRLEVDAADPNTGVLITHRYGLTVGSSCVERSVGISNQGSDPHLIDHLGSVAVHHLPYRDVDDLADLWLHTVGGGWCWEGALRATSLSDLGLRPRCSMGAHRIEATGSWSSKVILPMLLVEDREASQWWAVQVDHSASWRFEVGVEDGRAYLQAGLGSWVGAHWRRTLEPGDEFWSPTVVLAAAIGDRDDIANVLHGHRSRDLQRRRALPGAGDSHLPVVYNEFFASMGDPTEESVLERLAAIAPTGADVFLIDGGWHAPAGSNTAWWTTVGDWEADPERFPNGLAYGARSIASAGLLPGIWIEIESAGTDSRIVAEHPEWMMHRGGRMVEDNGRSFLDFGNPEARDHAMSVFERLWGFGYRYFKIDYNVDCSIGCDRGGSPGEGLVQHVRGLYALLDELHRRHPAIIIESCASGGSRLDGLWRHTDLCSISDHGFWEGAFHTYPALSYGLSLAVHPSQMGTWAGLDGGLSLDEIAFRMAAPLLGRVHLTGKVESLDDAQRDLVAQAIGFYKRWRATITSSRTYHHHQPGRLEDTTGWLAYEVAGDDASDLLGVWRRDDPKASIEVPLRGVDPEATYELEWFPSGRRERRAGRDLAAGLRCELGGPFTAAVVGMRPVDIG